MSNKYRNWYCVGIDISNAVQKDFDFDRLLAQTGTQNDQTPLVWTFDSGSLAELFNLEWLEYMQLNNLPVTDAIVFYRNPNYQDIVAHSDISVNGQTDVCLAINWVVTDNDDSQMVWYNVTDPTNKKYKKGPRIEYIIYPMASVEEIDSRTIGHQPTLVRVDIPHAVRMGNNRRFVITVRLNSALMFGHSNPQWEQIIEYFKDKEYITL